SGPHRRPREGGRGDARRRTAGPRRGRPHPPQTARTPSPAPPLTSHRPGADPAYSGVSVVRATNLRKSCASVTPRRHYQGNPAGRARPSLPRLQRSATMSPLLSALILGWLFTPPVPAEAGRAVAANNQLALDLYAQLGKDGDNLFLSPYSIDKALAMTYAGARGSTATEMAAVLHLPEDQGQAHRAFAAMRRQLNSGLHGVQLRQA